MEDFELALRRFSRHFEPYTDKFRLIGGAAMWLLMDSAGLPVRATKDLDIVLTIEVMNRDFGSAIWEFVRDGGYRVAQKSTGRHTFCRFIEPTKPGYPVMLEIFSRSPEGLELSKMTHVIPIPVSDDISSLSAILLDDSYYSFIHEYSTVIQGIPVVTEIGLIPMKAKAWIDMTERKAAGETIDSKNIRKHRTDVFRLSQLIEPSVRLALPPLIRNDLRSFLSRVHGEITPDVLRSAGIGMMTADSACDYIATVFALKPTSVE